MNRVTETIAGLFLSLAALHAQDPVLREPFVERAPIHSEWVEVIQPTKTSSVNPSTPPAPAVRSLKEITVTKADGTRREVSLWSDGLKSERWFYNDLVLFQQPGQPDVYIINGFQLKNTTFKGTFDISQSDFPKLTWISKANFKGMTTSNKMPCYHFEKTTPKPGVVLKPGDQVEAVTMHAWIDAETKLPVASDDGFSATTYSFKEIPKTSLELPTQFAKALAEYK